MDIKETILKKVLYFLGEPGATAASFSDNVLGVLLSELDVAGSLLVTFAENHTKARIAAVSGCSPFKKDEVYTLGLGNTPWDQTLQCGMVICTAEAWKAFPEYPSFYGIEAYGSILLYDQQGKALGILCIFDDKPFVDEAKIIHCLTLYALMISLVLGCYHLAENTSLKAHTITHIADIATVILWSVDEKGSIVFLNNAVERITGASANIFKKREHWYHLVHPEDRERLFATAQNSMVNRREFRLEYRLKFADGAYGWVLAYGEPRFSKNGYFCGISGFVLDIDEQVHHAKMNEAFSELEHSLIKGFGRKEALSALAQKLAAILDLPLVWLGLVARDDRVDTYASGGVAQEYLQKIHVSRHSKGVVALALHSAKPCYLERDDPGFADFAPLLKTYDLGGAFAVPIMQTASIQAVLTCYWPGEHPLPARTQQRILELAPRIGLALADIERQEWSRMLSTAVYYAADPVIIVGSDEVIIFVNEAFTHFYGYAAAEVKGQKLSLIGRTGALASLSTDSGQECQLCTKDGQMVVVEETVMPVVNPDDTIMHYVILHRDVSEKKKAEYLALHDPLTSLPSRVLFIKRLEEMAEQACLSNRSIAVFYCDINRFRETNEAYGHSVGDALLGAVAKRIMICLREGDVLGRLSGDEFGIILPDTTVDMAAKVAATIIEAVEIPFFIQGHSIHIGITIGIAMLKPEKDAHTFLHYAELAMDAAKQEEVPIRFFSEELNERVSHFLQLEMLLRHAVDEQRLKVYYQPIVDLQHDDAVIGAEALARLFDRHGKMISPAEFIPVAETSGLIGTIGAWVLKESLQALKRWHNQGLNSLRISVNVSALQLKNPAFSSQVLEMLEELLLDQKILKLELTESTIMEDAIHGAALIDLSQKGIFLSIDDFGTGYSSLSYLRKLPVKQLKIDRSFVMDSEINDNIAVIAQAIIGLGHTLGLEVLAEGIETKAQADRLREWGCDYGQGYYFAKPMPEEDFLKWLYAYHENHGYRLRDSF